MATVIDGSGNFNGNVPLNATNIASQAQAEAGTDNATIMTPLRVKQYTAANDLGWGQTWQNVAGSRLKDVAYQNTTGRPILVSMVINGSTTGNIQVSADNVTYITVAAYNGTQSTQSFIVPNGHYYKLLGTGTPTIVSWAELR